MQRSRRDCCCGGGRSAVTVDEAKSETEEAPAARLHAVLELSLKIESWCILMLLLTLRNKTLLVAHA